VKNYVLDTHTLIWYFIGSKKLKRSVKQAMDECRRRGGRLLVPTIVLAEALDIAEKQKVPFNFDQMYRLVQDEPGFEIVGFSPEIFSEITKIKEVKEIHDRVIVATARFYGAGVITKDKIIRESGEVEIL
jgi:PIN domain nuclease of toxin-antitoxin system